LLPASAADRQFSPFAHDEHVRTSFHSIGYAGDGPGKSQFLNDAIITKILPSLLAQEVSNPLLRSSASSLRSLALSKLKLGHLPLFFTLIHYQKTPLVGCRTDFPNLVVLSGLT